MREDDAHGQRIVARRSELCEFDQPFEQVARHGRGEEGLRRAGVRKDGAERRIVEGARAFERDRIAQRARPLNAARPA
ncbi:MAG: hypothetical protein NVS3B16_08770 [Vulcanimicrobiaceae bacterium]